MLSHCTDTVRCPINVAICSWACSTLPATNLYAFVLACCWLCRRGGLSFLIKTANNKWLGNAATYKDFFFSTSTLPEMPLVSAPSRDLAGSDAAGVAGPKKTLDAER